MHPHNPLRLLNLRTWSVCALGLFIAGSPLQAQNQRNSSSNKSESRSNITIVEDGKTRKFEIIKKDGKVWLNGKPLEEATAEDREWYDKHVYESGTERYRVYMDKMDTLRDRFGETNNVFLYGDEENDSTKTPRRRVLRYRGTPPMISNDEAFSILHRARFDQLKDHLATVPQEVRSVTGFAFGDAFDEGVMRLEEEARDLARQVRNASENEKRALEAKLDDKLNEIFEEKQEARRKNIERLEERIRAERETLDGRERARRDLIERRKRELLGKEDPMRW